MKKPAILSDQLKGLTLEQETFNKFGYWIKNLCRGTPKRIIHRCDVCGETKETHFNRFVKEMGLAHLRCQKIKRKQTWQKTLGVDNPGKSQQVQEKMKQTCLERYGVDNIRKSATTKEKLKTRNQRRWAESHGIESFDQGAIKYIRGELQKEGYQLLSDQYVGVRVKIEVQCPHQHKYEVRWIDFKVGYRCPICCERKCEKRLGEILEQLYPRKVKHHDYPDFLEGLELDFNIVGANLAFEYDGEQHYMPVRFGGMKQKLAEREFKALQKRDKKKNRLCKKNQLQLVRIKYDEGLTTEHIREKIEQCHQNA